MGGKPKTTDLLLDMVTLAGKVNDFTFWTVSGQYEPKLLALDMSQEHFIYS